MTPRDRIQALKAHCEKLPHGVRARYVAGCRCDPCRKANCQYIIRRHRRSHQGDYNPLVDAAPARDHLLKLSRMGVGRHSVAAATGISDSTLWGIIDGTRRKVRAKNLRRILDADIGVAGDNCHLSAKRAWKLLDELTRDGYSKRQLAHWMDVGDSIRFRRARMTARNIAKVEKLYRDIHEGRLRRPERPAARKRQP